jgi:hypothetical protein
MEPICCKPVCLPDCHCAAAARTAIAINPANRPAAETAPEHLAVVTTKFWGADGVRLTVGFLETIQADLRDRILSHMNAWTQFCNVHFTWTQQLGDAQVRITRSGDGYWSYLGTDILHRPAGEATMSLQGFTMQTPESEYHRVVRHETGHTLGFPHEHLRRELVARLDPAKTIAWGARQLGWSAQMVQQQILTPLDESSIRGTPHADQSSIMCYQLPASVTRDGQPIAGGSDIDPLDQSFAGQLYPLAVQPPPPPPASGQTTINIGIAGFGPITLTVPYPPAAVVVTKS